MAIDIFLSLNPAVWLGKSKLSIKQVIGQPLEVDRSSYVDAQAHEMFHKYLR